MRAVCSMNSSSARMTFVMRTKILENDWLIDVTGTTIKGTGVRMEISVTTKRTMLEIFNQYTTDSEDLDFAKTHVGVNLLRYGKENLVSRSQAKRLLARFDKFQEIILDFQGVNMIGQAFADEIFRVFKIDHPNITFIPVNTTEQIQKMIRRVSKTLDPS